MSIDFKKIKKQIKPSEQLVSDTIQKAKAIKRSSFSINIRKATAAAVFACLLIACLISAPFIFNQSNPPADVSNNSNNDFSTDSDNSTDTTEDFSSTDTDNSTGDVIDQPMYYWFYTADEFQTWVNNGGDNYSGSQYVLNVIKEEKGIILPCLKNSKYKFKSGSIFFNAGESNTLLILKFEGKNEDEYTEEYQAVNKIYIYVGILNKNDRNLDSKDYFISKYSKKRNYDEWYSSSSTAVNGGTVDYIYHDCNPSKDSEDRTSYAHIIIDKKWVLTIYQQNGLQMKPFNHEIFEWLDFETITYNDLSIDIKNDE